MPALLLLQLRELRIRDSDNVVTYGGQNLQQLAAAVPEEECKNVDWKSAHIWAVLLSQDELSTCRLSCAVWLVYEQVAIAALDSRAMALATSLIQKIRKKFPKSSRTHRLTVRQPISYPPPIPKYLSFAVRS